MIGEKPAPTSGETEIETTELGESEEPNAKKPRLNPIVRSNAGESPIRVDVPAREEVEESPPERQRLGGDDEASDEELKEFMLENASDKSEVSADSRERINGSPLNTAALSPPFEEDTRAPSVAVAASASDACEPVTGFTRSDLPPIKSPNEIEFILPDATKFAVSESTRGELCQPNDRMPFRFRLFVFPRGTAYANGEAISAFLEVEPAEVEGLGPLDNRWVFQNVTYAITVVNWHDYRKSVTKDNTWTFTSDNRDRGWHEFVPTAQLFDTSKGWMGPNGELCLRATAICPRAEGVDTAYSYNSKKETGYVGLKNHGATCYMNTLLQSLFLLGKFRELVYSLEFDESVEKDSEDEDNVSVAQALQEVFYKMQTSDTAQKTMRLMKSFGWDSLEAFTQHDAQELNRLLCDRLEIHIANSTDDVAKKGIIKTLFEGQMTNYIECMDCDYKSERTEAFWDIQLNIKGQKGQMLKNVEEAFEDFVSEEILEGDNAYDAGPELGKRRARKGIRFEKFPLILNLQLKRFQFDMEKLEMVKLNDRFEFSERLDISKYAPAGDNRPHTYDLHSVVVHRGDVHAGHYYVFCRPHIGGRWIKCDDDTVTYCSPFAVMDDNFGGEDPMITNYFEYSSPKLQNSQSRSRIHSAYMLVYLRTDQCEELVRPPDPQIINPKMVLRCNKRAQELEEKRRKKLERQHKISIQIILETDLQKLEGFWDHAKILELSKPSDVFKSYERDKTFKELLLDIAHNSLSAGIPASHLASFHLEYRTSPPEVARQVRFAHSTPSKAIKQIVPTFALPHFDPLEPLICCFILNSPKYDIRKGTVINENAENIFKNWQDNLHIMLIVKYFCRKTNKIVTLGGWHDFVGRPMKESIVSWALKRLNAELFGIAEMPWSSPDVTWRAWEEFGSKDLQERQLGKRASAKDEGLWSGDILILQAFTADEIVVKTRDPNENQFPVHPVRTVQDYSDNLANEAEITLVVHDPLERWSDDSDDDSNGTPLVVPNGDGISRKQYTVMLDKRWSMKYTSAVIARTIDETEEVKIENPASYWLFYLPPSKRSADPLNASFEPDEQPIRIRPTIGDYIQDKFKHSNDDIPGPKPRPTFHAVANPVKGHTKVPFCVRVFSDHVVEIKTVIVYLEVLGEDNDSVLAEKIVEQVSLHCDLPNPWRILRIDETDSKIQKIFRCGDRVLAPTGTDNMNIFCGYLRLEADDQSSGPIVEFVHAEAPRISLSDPTTVRYYGQPVLLPVPPTETVVETKKRLAKKLLLTDAEIRRWRFMVGNQVMRDEDIFHAGFPVYMMHERNKRDSRYNRALTMKR